jgi:hypothetical protein
MKKKFMVLLMAISMASLSAAAVPSHTLFSDNYDRADNHDIDAEATGMSGLLAPLTYVEIGDTIVPNTALTRIQSNQLYLAAGSNASTLYLDHNFVDSEILAADGMRVGYTIKSNLGPHTTGDFFCGFGIGNTLTECQNTWLDHNGTGFRGQHVGAQRAGTSDLWVGWSPVNGGTLQVFKNGPTVAGGENYALVTQLALTGNDRLELELYFDDFNDNSPVTAYIVWNGTVLGIEHFGWDADGLLENYLGINARQGTGFVVDDLAVEAIYNDRAVSPVPADGSLGVPAGPATLQWTKGKDASGNPNALVTQYYVYTTDELVGSEPNFAGYEIVTSPSLQIALDYDQTIYWRVDQSVLNNGIPSGPQDPNTIVGSVWSFETQKSVPVITSQPVSVIAEAGQPAQFSVGVESLTPAEFAWYRTLDNSTATPEDDVLMGTATDLAWTSPAVSDQGYYYCKITNDSGEANARFTAVVTLGIAREVAHWTFNAADLIDGMYKDETSEGHWAEPNIVPDATVFVDGVMPLKTAEAVDFAVQPLAVADAGDWAPSAFTGQFTLSAWVKWSGPNGGWQGILANRVSPSQANFYIEIRQDNGNVQLGSPHFGSGDLQGSNLPVGQWAHLAVTGGYGIGINIYIDGMLAASRTPARDIPFEVLPVYVGALGRTAAGVLNNPFNGAFDDVRLFNTAFDQYKIADLYYGISEKPLCLNPDNLDMQFDIAGGGVNGDQPDCRVDLRDMAALTASWLNCGLYPQDECL